MALGLGKAREATRARERQIEEAKERTFRSKVALQQFMNHNGPLFRYFAASGVPISEIMEGEPLARAAEAAMRLAKLVACDLTGKSLDEVTAADARPFRTDAAEWVANRLQSKAPLDIEEAASAIARAVRLADRSWDSDPYRDDGITSDASLMMTAASVAANLAQQVEIYDFRMGRDEVLGRIVEEVTMKAARTAREMLGPTAEQGDVRNLTQTLARNLSMLMEACYQRKAREVVASLNGRSEREKRDWYASHDPLGEVVSSFREWSTCMAGFAVAASREMMSSQPEAENRPER